MSALTNPVPPAPQPAPVPAHEPEQRGSRRWIGVLLVLLVAAAAGWYAWQARQKQQVQTAAVTAVTTAVKRGDLDVRVRVNGLTSARNFANVIAPRLRAPGTDRGLNILKLYPAGSFVKKGQIVAELDPQRVRDALDDENASLKEAQNAILKRKAEQDLDMETLNQNLRVAKSELDKAVLDAKIAEVRTDIDRELLRLAVEEADAQYKELSLDVDQKKASHKADMRYLEIAYEIQKMRVDRYQEDLEKLVIRAAMDGLVVMQTLNQPGGEQRQIQEGDQLAPGQPFMKIVDTKTMQVEGTINQTDSSHFRVGQDAKIGLDAFPGANYAGRVYSIGALAVSGPRQNFFIRTVPVRVQMTQVDGKVIPDLSASADVLLAQEKNAILAPSEAVSREGDKYFVEVKTARGFEKRNVQIGLGNGTHVAVVSGLNEGDEVRIG